MGVCPACGGRRQVTEVSYVQDSKGKPQRKTKMVPCRGCRGTGQIGGNTPVKRQFKSDKKSQSNRKPRRKRED